MIQTENLTKEYNGKNTVDNIDLEVGDGEIFGFLPEDVGFYKNLTGYENSDYPGKF